MAGGAAPPRKAGGFFKKPAWLAEKKANPQQDPNDEGDDATAIFARSRDALPEILADERRRRAQREHEAREEEERERKAREEGQFDSAAYRHPKKRRVDSCDDEDDEDEGPLPGLKLGPARIRTRHSMHQSMQPNLQPSMPYSMQQMERNVPTRSGPLVPVVIGGEQPFGYTHAPTAVQNNGTGMLKPSEDDVDDDDDDEDDPELRELARRARERARARQQEAEGQSAEALSNEPNPIISIFIHSETIPDTRELFVKRRYRQRLREVRLGWCKANNFGPVLTSQVFFTWRGRRLFDSADFRSVGVKLDEFGGPMMEGEGFNDDRIVFLATTQELETKAREAEERRRREEEAAAGGDEDEPEAAPEERIHVVLKAKGYEEFKLVVKPISTFAQIANAFRKERDIPANKEIILMFDGDCLEPEDTMAQSEIEDLDNIEVYLKD